MTTKGYHKKSYLGVCNLLKTVCVYKISFLPESDANLGRGNVNGQGECQTASASLQCLPCRFCTMVMHAKAGRWPWSQTCAVLREQTAPPIWLGERTCSRPIKICVHVEHTPTCRSTNGVAAPLLDDQSITNHSRGFGGLQKHVYLSSRFRRRRPASSPRSLLSQLNTKMNSQKPRSLWSTTAHRGFFQQS